MYHHRETPLIKVTHYDETDVTPACFRAKSEDPDKMSQTVTFYQGLLRLFRWKHSSGTINKQRIKCPAKGHFKVALVKVSKGAKIRSRYNQVPHPTQDTNGKVTNSQLDTTNESQEVSSFPAGDHKAHINRRAQRHSKHRTEQKHKRSTKEVPPWNGQ